jgi:uncharacterized membrane protein YdjX (TVP38/TMEM64 family)
MIARIINKKIFFYGFIVINIFLLLFFYCGEYKIQVQDIKNFLIGENFLVSYLIYIFILIIRGLTLFPGTIFLFAGIYVFSFLQVFFAIQIAIISYCFIIYNFTNKFNFKIPNKILKFEQKIKNKGLVIFIMCFIPGISINILIYFLSILKIKFKNILIPIVAGTSITSIIYIFIIKEIILLIN